MKAHLNKRGSVLKTTVFCHANVTTHHTVVLIAVICGSELMCACVSESVCVCVWVCVLWLWGQLLHLEWMTKTGSGTWHTFPPDLGHCWPRFSSPLWLLQQWFSLGLSYWRRHVLYSSMSGRYLHNALATFITQRQFGQRAGGRGGLRHGGSYASRHQWSAACHRELDTYCR